MAVKRSRPKASSKGKIVGPDFALGRLEAPWNAEIDFPFGAERDERTTMSEAGGTYEGGGAPLEKGNYDRLWEGK